MYFLLGILPWQGLKVKKNEDQFVRIGKKKETTSFEELTAGQPEEFLLYFQHCDKLEFEAQPNYIYLIGLFQNIIDRLCQDCFYDFDWKKDSYAYHSRTLKERKSIDVSLIVNRNNDASGIDYSYEGYEEEEGENDDENNPNYVKNKRIKKKEVFMGEDNSPFDNQEMQDNDTGYFNKSQTKIHRSRSMVNVNKKIKKKYEKNLASKKKGRRGSQAFNNNDSEYNSKQNKDNEETNNNENNNAENNEYGIDYNQNNHNNNEDYNNQNVINNSKNLENNYNYNDSNKRKVLEET
jgi:hypothetical protein